MVVAPDHSAKRRNGVAECSEGHAETNRCAFRLMSTRTRILVWVQCNPFAGPAGHGGWRVDSDFISGGMLVGMIWEWIASHGKPFF